MPKVFSVLNRRFGIVVAIFLAGCGAGRTVTAPPPSVPSVSLSGESLTFSSQPVGSTSSVQSIVLTNNGTGSLSITNVSVSGDFSQTNGCPGTLVAGGSCTFNIMFAPTTSGARTGALTISDNATGSPHSISLAGTGTAPGVQLSATSLSFGTQLVSTTSAAQAVTLTNTGNAALSVTSITASGDYTQTNTCGSSLAVGGSCSISVEFTPTTTGIRNATLMIADNAAGSPQLVSLTGTGTAPAIQLSAASLTFSAQIVSTTSAAQPVTLTNPGTASLSISNLTVSGDFAQTNTCGSSVGAGANCTISLTFTPTATGTRTGSVTITDNATGSPHTVALSGTGAASGVLVINPVVATITTSQRVQYAANLGVIWSVDGVAGGNASSGTITASGLYTPPAAAGTHTVSASGSGMSASGTVYVSDYPGVFTWHNDNARTGSNVQEIALSPANVDVNKFGKLFTVPVDGYVYAQPLYASNVNISGTSHNVVYVATEHDSLYAIDGDTGAILWQKSFIDPANSVTTIPSPADTGCSDLVPEVGITSTPVIDQSTATLYVLVRTKESGAHVQRLHAIDIATAAEKFSGPKTIQASVPGSGAGNIGGIIQFDPLVQNQRSALLLVNGHVIITWSSHCDLGNYHGWVMSYGASTLAQEQVFNLTPNGNDAAIWMSGAGPAADLTGNIYFASGNGTYNGTTDFGDSIAKLPLPPATGSWMPMDWFTPWNESNLSSADMDLGSGGVVLLPDLPDGRQLLVQAGKDGIIHLIDRNSMGKFCSSCTSTNTNIVQEIPGILNGMWSSPGYWNGTVYFGPAIEGNNGDTLKAVPFNSNGSGVLATSPSSTSAKIFTFSSPTPVITSNGNSNGVVWALDNSAYSSGACCQTLYAYDATNLGTLLYDTSQAPGGRDSLTGAVKFTIPTAANGKVYVAGQGAISAFGLLNAVTATAAPVFSPSAGTYSTGQSVTIGDATPGAVIYYTTDGTVPTTGSLVYSAAIAVNATTTINAMAVAPVFTPSMATATYTVNPLANGLDFGYGFAGAGSGISFNGLSAVSGTRLQLTNGESNAASSSFFRTPLPVGTFTCDFTFQLTSPVADGFTFTIQSLGANALGTSGGGLGYGPEPSTGIGPTIQNSVAVKFDLYSNQGEGPNSTGLYTNGAAPTIPAIDLTPSGVDLHSGDIMSAHLVYNGTNLTMTLTDTVTSKVFTNTWNVNIPTVLGNTSGYVGFTAGTGGSSATIEILSWSYHN